MKLLGIDLETTGLDFDKDRITEVGAVLWDWDYKTPLEMMSSFVFCADTPPLTAEIVKLTGIQSFMLTQHGRHQGGVLQDLGKLVEKADFIVAHNGLNFDKPMLEKAFEREHLPFWERPWIDTRIDIEYPEKITTRSLVHLTAEHGFVNPFPHRALFDVLSMFKVLAHYDLEQVIKYAKAPTITVRALVTYENRDKAKERRYRWDGDKKIWTKLIKDFQLEKEVNESPFKVVILKEGTNNG